MTSPEPEVPGTGSHVFLGWETADQVEKKRSRAQATGSHVFWNGKPRSNLKKGSWAQDRVKSLEKRGLNVQSPMGATGVSIKG